MTETPERTLEERVAALEAALAAPAAVVELEFRTEEWTPEQVAKFEAALAGHASRPTLLPPAPVLTPEIARALLRECVTVVQPGETLVIRLPDTWTPRQMEEYQEYADFATEAGRIPFRVLVVIGQELAVVQPEPDDTLAKRIKALLPGVLDAESRKAARL